KVFSYFSEKKDIIINFLIPPENQVNALLSTSYSTPEFFIICNHYNKEDAVLKKQINDYKISSTLKVIWNKPIEFHKDEEKNLKIFLTYGNVKLKKTDDFLSITSTDIHNREQALKKLLTNIQLGNGFRKNLDKNEEIWAIVFKVVKMLMKRKDTRDCVYGLALSLINHIFDNMSLNKKIAERLSFSPYVTLVSLLAPHIGLLTKNDITGWDGRFYNNNNCKAAYFEKLEKILFENDCSFEMVPINNKYDIQTLIFVYNDWVHKKYSDLKSNYNISGIGMLIVDIFRCIVLSDPYLKDDKTDIMISIISDNICYIKKPSEEHMISELMGSYTLNSFISKKFLKSELVKTVICGSRNNRKEEEDFRAKVKSKIYGNI
ncbi:MAG: hypothetical protein KDH96_07725, partial [Candidatus Riesia sp.]|nr:hypothetical protein [Candidatus Riesia sp.]